MSTRAFFVTKHPSEFLNLDGDAYYSIENESLFPVYLFLISPGAVAVVNVTNPGSGYEEIPIVAFSHGGGKGAAAEAIVHKGLVTSIVVTQRGDGYGLPPLVTIAMPDEGEQATAVSSLRPSMHSSYDYKIEPLETIEIPPFGSRRLYGGNGGSILAEKSLVIVRQ